MQGDRLFFRVISTVAGVTTSLRKYAPGEKGELQRGHFLKFSDYTLNAEDAPVQESALNPDKTAAFSKPRIGSAVTPDPWAELDSQWAGQEPKTLGEFAPSSLEPNPFSEDSDWELGSSTTTSNPDNSQLAQTAAMAQPASAIQALLLGLGIEPSQANTMPDLELHALGRRIRAALLGIITLEANMEATQAKLGFKHNDSSNLLLGNQSPSKKLAFLLTTTAAHADKQNADDALNDIIVRLHAHEAAMMAASRATAMGVLTDLDPAALKARFEKSGPHLPMLVSGKLWDFFGKHYEGIGANLPRWLADTMSRHFAPYYSREYDKNRKS
jgi:predicted component of type VI protein secretion system